MTDMFIRDIEQGIADTGIKAAILKCATDEPGVTPGVERVLRAVAQAHRHTGVPISTHTHAGTRRGLEQQRIFAEEGVDLSRVVIGHSGDTTDVDYLEELIGNGSYIGMDRFGVDVYLPFEDRVDTVARMCERGHAEKMVLSHDASLLLGRAAGGDAARRPAELALPAHPQRRHPRAEGTRRHRRTTQHDAGWQSPQNLREPGRLLMTAPVPPIGTQFSLLAERSPDEPAVTCEGRTLTRGELEASSNRLARAYAELGVGQGDYVTIVLPNSIEWMQAALAAWKLGAVPQPLSARLPDAELEGLLELKPRALLVGRTDPRGVIPSVPGDFTPDSGLSDAPLPEAVSPSWKALGSGGSTGQAQAHRGRRRRSIPGRTGGPDRWARRRATPSLIAVPLSHNTGMTTATVGLLMRQHLVLMPRFDASEFLRLVTEHRVDFIVTVPTIMQRLLPAYRADPGRLRLVVDPAAMARRCGLPAGRQGGLDRSARPRGGLGVVRRHRTSGA